MTSFRPLLFMFLITVVAAAGLAAFDAYLLPAGYFFGQSVILGNDGVALTLMTGVFSLVVVWVGIGASRWAVRFAGLIVSLFFCLLLFLLSNTSGELLGVVVLLGEHMVSLYVGLLPARVLGFRVLSPSQSITLVASSAEHERRYWIIELVLLTAALAAVLGEARLFGPSERVFLAEALVPGAITLFVTWAVLGGTRWWARLLAAAFFVTTLGVGLGSVFGGSSDAWLPVAIETCVAYTMYVTSSLTVFRCHGYRLARCLLPQQVGAVPRVRLLQFRTSHLMSLVLLLAILLGGIRWWPLGSRLFALKYGTASVREWAVSDLGRMEEAAAPAIPSLILALQDPFPDVRSEAARSLGSIGSPAAPAMSALLDALANDNGSSVRRSAARSLGSFRPDATHVVDALIRALGDGEWNVHYEASSSLRDIGTVAVQPLIDALQDENHLIREEAAWTLGCMEGPEVKHAVAPLRQLLQDQDVHVRLSAAQAVARIEPGCAEGMAVLIRALQNNDSSIRSTATTALCNIGPAGKDAVPALIIALRDEESGVRRGAAYALGRIGPGAIEAVPALNDTLKDPHVQSHAAEALKKIDPPVSVTIP